MATFWKTLAQWGLVLVLLFIATHLKTPLLLKIRNWDVLILVIISLILICSTVRTLATSDMNRLRRVERTGFLLIVIGISFVSFTKECFFYHRKQKVLNISPSQTRFLGSHFIVGYTNYEEIRRLVSKGAIRGIYVTHRNVRKKTVEQVRKEIRHLQDIQKSLGLPPLFVAADQEGGVVSSLSPPLSKLPPLSSLLKNGISEKLDKEVAQYAITQADALSSLGVNVNLSPVVDLNTEQAARFPGFHTRLYERAISADTSVVTRVALTYSRTLEKHGVMPTLKHFPGLGRIREDTHYTTGELDIDPAYLEKKDWVPFREILQKTGAFMMLGHVKLSHIDPANPVSFSESVIQNIIRKKWGHDGILITDDLNMGPAYASEGGIGGAAIKALNAGVDLLLISYDGAQYYEAMDAVVQAWHQKKLNPEILAKSRRRLDRLGDKQLVSRP